MLKICNNALLAADNGIITLVVLLDYSAALNTVDHAIMLGILERRCGLTGEALQWHTSYLHCRSYAMAAGGATSETVYLDCMQTTSRFQSRAAEVCHVCCRSSHADKPS